MKLSINQCANAVANLATHTTVLIEGPSGTGKSSILHTLAERFPDHKPVYIDCTQIDVGDIQIPAVDHATKTSTFYPNEVFGTQSDEARIICLDEFGKASRPVQNALLPVLLDRRVGHRPLPQGSLVFGTTNLSSEGVGDAMQMHVRNRMSVITMRKPTAPEWVEWGVANGVHHAVLAWVTDTPQVLAEEDTVQTPAENPYIHHRGEQRKAFVTPRSLAAAGRMLNDRDAVGDDEVMRCALAGALGARAALDLMAYVELADGLPSWGSIIGAPDKAKLPATPTTNMMTVHRAVHRVEKDTLDNVLTYMQRLPKELQAVFATNLLRQKHKSAWTALNRAFTQWCVDNSWILR
jgi:energy-coupling factor transporter ATP-binding protein EcfA2